ncbi:hypothetical protein [Streptomyces sp. NPDC014777]
MRAQCAGWGKLLPPQLWQLSGVLGLEPLPEDEAARPARRSQD